MTTNERRKYLESEWNYHATKSMVPENLLAAEMKKVKRCDG